ncbi:replication protein RepA [Azospirillum doebereinerae]
MAKIHEQLSLEGFDAVLARTEDPKERRRVIMAHEAISNEIDAIGYLHAGFCQASLPHRKPKDEQAPWVRNNGRYQLVVRPGILPLRDGTVLDVGVPYGAKARLIMIYLQTEARKTRTPHVDLGPSMSAWLRRLGLAPTGGERGNYKPVREQVLRIARCEFTLRTTTGNSSAEISDQRLIDGIKLWRDDEDAPDLFRTGGEWVRFVRLTSSFFDHLMEHAVPLDEHAIAKLKNSALALDAYVWLVHRLHRLDKQTLVPWHALSQHFGSVSEHRVLAFRLKEALKDVMAVYPDANIEPTSKGLLLRPSAPAVPSNKHSVLRPVTLRG